jgi:hypothetical protein
MNLPYTTQLYSGACSCIAASSCSAKRRIIISSSPQVTLLADSVGQYREGIKTVQATAGHTMMKLRDNLTSVEQELNPKKGTYGASIIISCHCPVRVACVMPSRLPYCQCQRTPSHVAACLPRKLPHTQPVTPRFEYQILELSSEARGASSRE